MTHTLFTLLGTLATVYSLLCFARILMAWVLQLEHTPVGQILASLCDPYLRWFRRFGFTRVGMFDFSPILALGILSVLNMSFKTLAFAPRITIGGILSIVLRNTWYAFRFLPFLLILLLVIRLINDLFNRYGYSRFWIALDRILNPVISSVTRLFGRGKTFSYRVSLIITIVTTLLMTAAAALAVDFICDFLSTLPI